MGRYLRAGAVAFAIAMLSQRRISRLAGESLTVAAGRILAAAGTLMSVRVLTEILEPEVYGEVALAMTAVLLMQQTWTGPIGQSAMRFYASALDSLRLDAHLAGVWDLFLGGLLLVVLCLTLAFLWAQKEGTLGWVGLAALACVLAAISGAGAVIDDLQAAARRRLVVAFHQSVSPWLRLLGAYLVVLVFGSSSASVLIGMTAAAVVVWASQYGSYRGNFVDRSRVSVEGYRLAKDGEWRARLIAYAWPFMVWGLFAWAQTATERWAIAAFVSTSEVGKYAALYQIGFFPMVFGTQVVSQVLAPVLFARSGSGDDRDRVSNSLAEFHWVIVATVIVVLSAVVVTFGFHEGIARVLLASPYREVSSLLPVLVAAGGAFSLGQLLALGPLAYGRPMSLLAPKIGSGISSVGLVLLGAWVAGVEGVAWGVFAGSLIYAVWQLAQIQGMDTRPGVQGKPHA